MLFFILLDILL